MEELLKELGYTDEQIQAILTAMSTKKIYTTKEENADIRLQKLNEDFTGKEKELTKANDLIEQLQKSNKGNEDLQSKITDYETEIAKLQEEQQKKDIDNALKFGLLKNKANADDIDYLIFKIKENKDREEFKIDENGNLTNFDFEDIKKSYSTHFEQEKQQEVDVKKLGGNGKEEQDDKPQNLLEALTQHYTPNTEL